VDELRRLLRRHAGAVHELGRRPLLRGLPPPVVGGASQRSRRPARSSDTSPRKPHQRLFELVNPAAARGWRLRFAIGAARSPPLPGAVFRSVLNRVELGAQVLAAPTPTTADCPRSAGAPRSIACSEGATASVRASANLLHRLAQPLLRSRPRRSWAACACISAMRGRAGFFRLGLRLAFGLGPLA